VWVKDPHLTPAKRIVDPTLGCGAQVTDAARQKQLKELTALITSHGGSVLDKLPALTDMRTPTGKGKAAAAEAGAVERERDRGGTDSSTLGSAMARWRESWRGGGRGVARDATRGHPSASNSLTLKRLHASLF
jgi:hypothetical protein